MKDIVASTLGKLNVPLEALYLNAGPDRGAALDAELAMSWLKEFFARVDGASEGERCRDVQRREVGAEELA